MLSWGFYQRYFDVDTPQVKERLMWSFIPRPAKDTLSNFIRPSPDLYGIRHFQLVSFSPCNNMYPLLCRN